MRPLDPLVEMCEKASDISERIRKNFTNQRLEGR